MFYLSHHLSSQQPSRSHYPHLKEKDTDAWRGCMTCPRSSSYLCDRARSRAVFFLLYHHPCGQSTVECSKSEGSLTQATLALDSLNVSFNLFSFFIGTNTISICPSHSIYPSGEKERQLSKNPEIISSESRKCEVEKSKAQGEKSMNLHQF